MAYLLNILYLIGLLVVSPWLCYRALTTGKYRRGVFAKATGLVAHPLLPRTKSRPTAWFHGVSVGEIHLLRQVIARFRSRHPDWQCVVSTTTDTGHDEATKCFADLPVVYWPFDFTWAIRRAFQRIQPDLLVLAEGEIWPNVLQISQRAGVKLAMVNGRISPKSARRFGRFAWLAKGLFARFDLIAAQTEEYADGYRRLGAKNVVVTGSVKYDGTAGDRRHPRTQHLRRLLGIGANELVLVAGSTQSPEEACLIDFFQQAQTLYPNLRLILVPRQKDRFEEVAQLLEKSTIPFLRRSQLLDSPTRKPPSALPILLVDTIGELGAVWGLADVAFVGGSLDGHRGGQNMIEPAAYGAAVVFGPHTWNFKDTVARLLDQQAAIEVPSPEELHQELSRLLGDEVARGKLGNAARRLVATQQGATERTLNALNEIMPPPVQTQAA